MDIMLLNLLGHKLSLFHLISLLLVLGICLDYSLFFNRESSTTRDASQTLIGITVCMVSTLAVFGLLALSDIPVLAAIGSTVAMGVALGYILSFVMNSASERSVL